MGGETPIITVVACKGNTECVRMCIQLGANVQPLLERPNLGPAVTEIVQEVRSFLDATALAASWHQYTLYSITQLAAFYLQRHASKQKQDTIDNFALRFAGVIQNSLSVEPFEAAGAALCCHHDAKTRRKLVLLAAGTAIDAAVSHAASEGKPIDAALVVEVMNLLMSRDCVRDLFSLRTTCKLTRRGSFPVPSYPLLELPTSVMEDFVGGSGSRHVSF
jgi:hypothetical protein